MLGKLGIALAIRPRRLFVDIRILMTHHNVFGANGNANVNIGIS